MDINLLRAAVTVTGLVLFLALVVWAWSRQRRADFDAAAHLPFADSGLQQASDSATAAQHGARS